MTARYFVVEGKNDERILRHLLPKALLADTKIIVSSGYSAALSVIQTLFTLTPLPISFFFDADTYSDEKLEERKQFINSYLKKVFANEFLLFPFKPEMEILFFYDKTLLEALVSKKIDDDLWFQAKSQPKKILTELIGKNDYWAFLERKLTDDMVKKLQKNPEIQHIIKQHSIQLTSGPQTVMA